MMAGLSALNVVTTNWFLASWLYGMEKDCDHHWKRAWSKDFTALIAIGLMTKIMKPKRHYTLNPARKIDIDALEAPRLVGETDPKVAKSRIEQAALACALSKQLVESRVKTLLRGC